MSKQFLSLDSLEFFRRKLSSYPLTKSFSLLLHQAVLFTNLNASVDLAMWVELIRNWVIGSNNMFLALLEIKLSHHVNNQNDIAVPVSSSVVIRLLANTFCLTSLAPKPTQTIILEFFTNAVLPFNWKWWSGSVPAKGIFFLTRPILTLPQTVGSMSSAFLRQYKQVICFFSQQTYSTW